MKRLTRAAFGAAATCLLSTTALGAPELAELQAPPPPPELLPMTGITVTKVAIEAGRLIVEGKTPAPRITVTIDGRGSVTSDRKSVFRFSLVYLPEDCVIEISTAAGGSDQATVSNCGPKGERGPLGLPGPAGPPGAKGADGAKGVAGDAGPAGPKGDPGSAGPKGDAGSGVTPKGAWSSGADYVANDLATHAGSTWRALQASTNKEPGDSPSDWQLFAAKGDDGEDGEQGPKGDPGNGGPQGPPGPAGPSGPIGLSGETGPKGDTGEAGPKGDTGLSGVVYADQTVNIPYGWTVIPAGVLYPVCSASITTTGGKVLIQASNSVTNVGRAVAEITILSSKNGGSAVNVVAERGLGLMYFEESFNYQSSHVSWLDNPPAGSQMTYHLAIKDLSETGQLQVGGGYPCIVRLIELKS